MRTAVVRPSVGNTFSGIVQESLTLTLMLIAELLPKKFLFAVLTNRYQGTAMNGGRKDLIFKVMITQMRERH